eukprot:363183-Chlamydomonas_euryale.AAC.2
MGRPGRCQQQGQGTLAATQWNGDWQWLHGGAGNSRPQHASHQERVSVRRLGQREALWPPADVESLADAHVQPHRDCRLMHQAPVLETTCCQSRNQLFTSHSAAFRWSAWSQSHTGRFDGRQKRLRRLPLQRAFSNLSLSPTAARVAAATAGVPAGVLQPAACRGGVHHLRALLPLHGPFLVRTRVTGHPQQILTIAL